MAPAPHSRRIARAISDHGALFVGCVALVLRLAALAELSDAPSFYVPIVDEANYDRLARDLCSGHGLGDRYFWQGLFYPLFLASVYAVTHGSVLAARVSQAFVGSIGAALTCKLGEHAGGRKIGMAAGLVVACSGPLIFSDFELVGTAWEVLWATSLPLVAVRIAKNPDKRWLAVAGCLGGLSIVTRAAFVPFVAVLALWIALQVTKRMGRRAGWTRTSVFVAGLLAVLAPAALVSRQVTGEARVLPYSGGINLYIGNNPDMDKTIQVRPGPEWDRLASLPTKYGAVTPAAKEAFFLQRVRAYAKESPLRFVAGLGDKLLAFVCSREIARNLDVYTYGSYSNILSLTTWRLARFGFPFGVLFPLALFGAVLSVRELPAPLRILMVAYPLAVIAVFVSARYRAPVLPALAIAGTIGARAVWRAMNAKRWRDVAWSSALAATGVAASVLPGPFPGERGNYRSEMLTFVAIEDLEHDRLDAAEPLLRTALEGDPKDKRAHTVLGTVLLQRGDLDAAATEFEAALQIDPDDGQAQQGMGNLYVLSGRPALGLAHFLKALETDPGNVALLNNVGKILHGLGDDENAAVFLRRALAVNPELDVTRSNLAEVLQGSGRVPAIAPSGPATAPSSSSTPTNAR